MIWTQQKSIKLIQLFVFITNAPWFNGLLLCPNHDKLFDKGFISFDNNGNILISNKLDKTNRMFLNIGEQMKIDVNADNIEFIEYHRKNIFKK